MKTLIRFLIILLVPVFIFSCSLLKKNSTGKIQSKSLDTKKVIKSEKYGKIVINEFCLVLKDDYDRKDAEKIASGVNGKITGEIEYMNIYQVELTTSDEENLINAINEAKKSEGTLFVFTNSMVERRNVTNSDCNNPFSDEVYSGSNGFAFKMLGIKQAWDIIKASGVELKGVTVGICDDPVNLANTELEGEARVNVIDEEQNEIYKNLKEQYEKGKKTGMSDDAFKFYNKINTHGNEVANIIGANSKDGGVSGIASIIGNKLNINFTDVFEPDEKAEEKYKENPDFQLEKGSEKRVFTALVNMMKQVDKGAKVINCSFGTFVNKNSTEEEKQFYKNIAKTTKKFLEKMNREHPDVIFVGAAGNNDVGINGENDFWGHKLPNLITVGAVNSNGDKSSYSHYGEGEGEVTISAFDSVMTSNSNKEIGTSFTAPQVSGVIALMKSINPDLSAEQIRKIINETKSKSFNGKDIPANMGGGFLRADDAVLRVINDLRKKEGKTLYTKENLLDLAGLELSSKGGPKDFKITAEVKAVNEKGTTLTIEASGNNYAITGDKTKSLSQAGSVSWDVTLLDPTKSVTITVRRLVIDACRKVELGGEIKAEDLVGNWTGNVRYLDWSTSFPMAKKQIDANLAGKKNQPLPLTISSKLVDENTLMFTMQVKGGTPIPNMEFSFKNNQLTASFVYNRTNYHYSAAVTAESNKIKLKGEWNTTVPNGALDMNGTWEAELPEKKK